MSSLLERAPILRGSSPLLLGGVFAFLIIAWGYVVSMAWGMKNMDISMEWWTMPRMRDWGGADLALVFAMWAIMMAAMMLPSAVPLLLLLSRSNSQRYSGPRALLATSASAFGYLTA